MYRGNDFYVLVKICAGIFGNGLVDGMGRLKQSREGCFAAGHTPIEVHGSTDHTDTRALNAIGYPALDRRMTARHGAIILKALLLVKYLFNSRCHESKILLLHIISPLY